MLVSFVLVETKGNLHPHQFYLTNEKCAISYATINFILGLYIFTFIYLCDSTVTKRLKVNKNLRCHIHFLMLDREGSIT